MVNQSTLQGNWKQIKGKLREKWGNLAEDDVASFNGNVDQLVGKIQQKTGESRQAVEKFLEEVSAGGTSMAGRAGEAAQQAASYARDAAGRVGEAAQQAGNYVRDTAGQVRDSMSEGYGRAEEFVQERPAQSLAFAFGCGVAVGIGLALMFFDRPQPSTWERGRETVGRFGRQMRDKAASMLPERFYS
jgi:uncharacterized protein YjbJ (UPF0337 family)